MLSHDAAIVGLIATPHAAFWMHDPEVRRHAGSGQEGIDGLERISARRSIFLKDGRNAAPPKRFLETYCTIPAALAIRERTTPVIS